MLKARLIPCLDVKDGRVVKGVNFVDLRDAGDPVEIAKAYDAAGADELCFLDITATHENRGIIFDVVQRTAEACFMPLTVGGGVRTLDDIRKLLLAGADKVSINSAAVANRDFVRQAAQKFGAQCVVVAIDAKQVSPGKWEIFTHGGIIVPKGVFGLVHRQFRLGEEGLARGIRKPIGVVGVHMRQQHRIDRCRRDPGGRQILEHLAAGCRHRRATAGIDQGDAPARADQEGVHRGASGQRAMRLPQDARGVLRRDVLDDGHGAIEEPVADRGHYDIADPAMMDRGDLLRRMRHGRSFLPWHGA
jgi:hypothetical protein